MSVFSMRASEDSKYAVAGRLGAMPRLSVLFAVCLFATAVAAASGGCIAAIGGGAGLNVDSKGNTAVVARGWYRSGSRLNKERSSGKTAEWGMPLIPQIELGVGYDISRQGLRLEGALPFLGFIRAPLDAGGQVLGAHVGVRFAGTVLDGLDDDYFTIQGYLSFQLSKVRSLNRAGSRRSDWDGDRTYRAVGARVETGIGGGSTWGSVHVGAAYDYIKYYNIYLSEGPDEPPPRDEPPPEPPPRDEPPLTGPM